MYEDLKGKRLLILGATRDECEIVDGCIADKDWFCADGERRLNNG